jgi:hypothetical protein
MIRPVGFEGVNSTFTAPAGMEDQVITISCFVGGDVIITALRFEPEDIAKLQANGGVVWLSHMGGRLPPFLLSVDALVQMTEPDGTTRDPKVEPILERTR